MRSSRLFDAKGGRERNKIWAGGTGTQNILGLVEFSLKEFGLLRQEYKIF